MDDPDEQRATHDLSYDLSHGVADDLSRPRAPLSAPPVTVVTGTPDEGGDYSYDLAHDIPPAGVG